MLKIKEIKTGNVFSKTGLDGYYYVINPYTGCTHKCIYCYACFMNKFSGHEEDWGEYIDIKRWDGVVRTSRKIHDKNILIGSVTDPYDKNVEPEYKNTRDILEKLRGTQCIPTICTKSDLVLRDIDLLKQLHGRVSISLCSLDEQFVKQIEKASTVKERLNALKKLNEEGIYTILCLSPMFPYITKFKKIIEETKDYVDEYWFENLNLRQPYKNNVLNFIMTFYNNYWKRYENIYVEKDYEYWHVLKQDIINYCEENKLKYKIDFRYN